MTDKIPGPGYGPLEGALEIHEPVSPETAGAPQIQRWQPDDVLWLFREFVLQNATQWKTNASHHHPVWALVAETLAEKNTQRCVGPHWAFICSHNDQTPEPPGRVR